MLYILASFLTCGAVFLGAYWRHKNLNTACEIASIFHHALVTIIGTLVAIVNFEHILTEGIMGDSNVFPGVRALQHINIGYFLYDTIHAVIWDHAFIAHHLVCLVGFCISDYTGCYGLANAVNTAVAEMGSLMYNQYNKNKTLDNLKRFVACYTISRALFMLWSVVIIYKSFTYTGDHTYPAWTPYMGTFLQLAILGVNVYFIIMHTNTLRARIAKGE